MSDIVNTATIKVVTDASEATAGLRPLDDSIAKTGKSLENLEATAKRTGKTVETVGQSPGLERVGDGAGTAAVRVDRATKNMADSIQRATTAMSAGAKGSAAYYEALANSRGINVGALRPYLAQLEEATRKADLAADAQRRLDESTKFLDGLRSRTEGIGKSASQLAALRAEQLGVSEAAAGMIAKLREQEEAGESVWGNLGEMAGSFKEVLLGLAAGAAAAGLAIGALVNNAINDLAELDDMAQKTGSSVESLSKIQKVAAVFGPDMGAVSGALDKLAKGMATVDDESNKTQKALSALGVSAKDSSNKLRDPSEVLVDAAKALQNYNDGAAKTAIITDLIGKSGADLLPFLNDLAENYDKVGSVSSEAASAAAGFQDQLGWMKLQFKDLFTAIAVDALPALSDLAGAFQDVYKGQADLAEGKGKEWADEMALGIAQAADAAVILGRSLAIIWNSLKAVLADMKVATTAIVNLNPVVAGYKALNGGSALGDLKKAVDERNKVVTTANERLEELLNRPLGQFENAFLERMKARGKEAEAPAGTKSNLNYEAGNDKSEKAREAALKKEEDAYASLTAAIAAKTEENRLEIAVSQQATESQKLQIKIDQETATGKLKLTDDHKRAIQAKLDDLAASEKLLKADQAQREVTKYINESTQARQQQIAALGVEYAMYGKSADARSSAMAAVEAQTWKEKELAKLREDNKPISDQIVKQLDAEAKARAEVSQAVLGQTKALQYAAQLEDENKKFGIQYIADDKLRAAAQLSLDTETWEERIRLAGEGTEAQKILQQNFDTWYQNQSVKPYLEDQKRTWSSVENTAHETFISIFDSGKSALDRLRDTLKNGLLDLFYQMTIKKWVINVQADVTGSILGSASSIGGQVGAGSGNPLGSLMSASSIANAGSKAWSSVSGGFAGLSDAVAGGVQSAMSAMGYTPLASQGLATAGGQALTPLANGAGAAAGYLGGAAVGIYGGRALSGGYAISGSGNGLVNVGTIAGAIVGGPIGAAIGGLIGGAANRLFGRKAPEIESQGIRGSYNGNGNLTGQNYQNIVEKGGIFRSTKRYPEAQALAEEMQSQLGQAFLAITDSSTTLAKSLGLGADSLSNYSKLFDIKLTGDAAKDQQAIEAFFGGVADEVANKLVPSLAQFSQTGEAAATTLQRLAGEFDATTIAAQNIGKTAEQVFGSIGLSSAASRERLVQLAGGTSSLTSLTGSYAQNYLSEAERLAPVSRALDEALGKLALSSIPNTRDEFKKLVDGFDLTSEAQAKQFVSLMQLGDAFALVHPATEDTADAAKKAAEALAEVNKGYQQQIDELVKASLPAAEVRAMEIAGMDASTVALYDRLRALQKEASVAEERKGLQDQLDELTMTSAQLLEKQRAALDESNRALFDQIQSIKSLKDAASTLLGGVDNAFSVLQKVVSREKDLLQKRIDSETEAVSRLKSLTDTISSTLDGTNVSGADAIGRQTAQAQIKAALASVKGGAQLSDDQIKSLGKALGAVSQDSSKQFGSKEDYLFDFLTTRNDIAQLGDLTGDQLSAEEKALEQLQDQSKALDDMLAKTQDQIDILKGISTTGLSIEQALYGVQTAIVAAQQNSVASAASAIAKAYQDALGRNPDSAGMEFWQNQVAAGTSIGAITGSIKNSSEAQVRNLYQDLLGRSADAGGLSFFLKSGASLSEIAAAIKSSDEYKKLHGVPGFAAGGIFGGGLRIVGENGPELEATGPSRIWSSNQTAALLARASSPDGNSAALAEAVRDLKSENAKQRGVIETMAKDMAAMATILKGVSPNGTFIKTRSN